MTPSKVVRRLVSYAPAVIAQWSKPDYPRCILATRIGCDVLRAFALEAAPLPVVVDVANARFFEWAAQGGTREQFLERGCWLITNEPKDHFDELPPQVPRPARGTNQHVVLHVPRLGVIVDLDLRQMQRPQKGIVPPDAIMLPWDGVETGQAFGWGGVRYRPWPTEVASDWQDAGDWQKGPHAGVTEALVRAVRKGR